MMDAHACRRSGEVAWPPDRVRLLTNRRLRFRGLEHLPEPFLKPLGDGGGVLCSVRGVTFRV